MFLISLRPTLITKVIKGAVPSIPKDYSPTIQELVRSLLNKDPKLRPSATAILKSSFIQKFIQMNTPPQISLVSVTTNAVKINIPSSTSSNPMESPRRTTQQATASQANIPEKRGMVTPTRDKKIQLIPANGAPGSGNSKAKRVNVKEKESQGVIPVSPMHAKIKKDEKARRSSGANIVSKNSSVNPSKQASVTSRRQSSASQPPISLNLVSVPSTSVSSTSESSVTTVLKPQEYKSSSPIENKENAKDVNYQSIPEDTTNPTVTDLDEFPVMQCATVMDSDTSIMFPVTQSYSLGANDCLEDPTHWNQAAVDTNIILQDQDLSISIIGDEDDDEENEELIGSGSLSKRISFIKNQCIADLGASKFQKVYEFIKKNNDPVVMESPSFALRIRDILGVDHNELVGKYTSLIQQLIMCEEAVQ